MSGQLDLFRVPPPPPVKKTVTAFQGTRDEMVFEITVQPTRRGRRWRNEITQIQRIKS